MKSEINFGRDNCVDFNVIVTELYPTQTRSIAIKFSKDKDVMFINNMQQFKWDM